MRASAVETKRTPGSAASKSAMDALTGTDHPSSNNLSFVKMSVAPARFAGVTVFHSVSDLGDATSEVLVAFDATGLIGLARDSDFVIFANF